MQKEDGRSIPREALESYRFRTIQLHKEGKQINEIAYFFGVHRGSVSRWITLFKRNGKHVLKRKKAKGADYKLSKNELKDTLSMLYDDATIYGFENPLWNCKMVQQMIFKKTGKTMHPSGIRKLFRKLNLSPQKPERLSPQKNKRLVKKWVREEWPKIEEHRRRWQAMIYFLDESGVSLTPVLGRTWAPKGKTPKVMVTGNRGGLCVTSAISPAGKLIFRIEKEKINFEKHIEFLKKIIKQHPNRKIIVIEDRAPPHKAKKVDKFVEENKNKLAIYRLPPYSPELNPTEHIWAYIKAYELKTHQAQNTQELKHLVKRKMQSIQRRKKLIHSFFSGLM